MKTLVYILFLIPLFAGAQLTTNTAMSPSALVQNVLLGPGVQVSNILYTGVPQAIGQFSYSGTNLGLSQGIIITTGTVFPGSNGPQGPNDDGGSGTDNNAGGAAILNGILGTSNTFNAAVLEFDFIAQGELVSFNYIFGSEEYLEFVDAGYNDVFGLFISGPGIIGTQNIAKLPNSTIVSIDNVNSTSNSAFYVDNGNGFQSPYNGSNSYIQYDGFTKPLTASSPVQCGQTYHLTIAIADVGDGIFDSGIFLEAESLTSEAPTNIDFDISNNYFNDPTIIAEGCTSADFTFTRTNTDDPIVVPIVVTGTAQNGVDYSNTIPASIILNAGQSTGTFTFDAIVDGFTEGLESIIITFQIPNNCNTVTEQSFTLQIQDVEPITVSLENDTITCDGSQSITLVPTISGGLDPITYQWDTGPTTPTLTVSPNVTTIYSVTVTDGCLNSTATDDAEIYIPPAIPIVIQPLPDITEICPFVTHVIIPSVSGGQSQYVYSWEEASQVVGTNSSLTIQPPNSTSYTLTVSDLCGQSDQVSFNFTVLTKVLVPAINTPAIICPGDSVLLSASATFGLGAYSYDWIHSGETTPDVWVTPMETTTYTVNISDECQTYLVPISTTAPVYQPYANFTYNSANLELGSPIQFDNLSANGVSYTWDLGNGFTSTLENPITTYNEIGTYEITLISVDNVGCIDTVTKTIEVGHLMFIPNVFTPDGNRFNNEFEAVSLNVNVISFEIYDRWGELIYESTNDNHFSWDGTYKGKPCPDGVYVYKIRYLNPSRKEFNHVGHVTLLR